MFTKTFHISHFMQKKYFALYLELILFVFSIIQFIKIGIIRMIEKELIFNYVTSVINNDKESKRKTKQ